MVAATELIRPTTRFQRAIHLRYDLRDPETVRRYIPTLSASNALASILRGTLPQAEQRSHVLHAAYGSGKSHFAVALAALLEKPSPLVPAVGALTDQLAETETTVGALAEDYLKSDQRLLPVVLSGNEGDFATSVLRALSRSLDELGIDDVALSTRFDAAIQTIERWESTYPDTLQQLEQKLQDQYNETVPVLLEMLGRHDPAAYQVFTELYIELTAGATFDPVTENAPQLVYRDVVEQLAAHGDYSGIVVIWDEFGRYLESRATQAFSNEAALLQEFAETCNHTGEAQLHLVLLTHKELQGYATALPKSYQQEWSRIEGRFQRHNVTTDPYVAYRLVASAVEHGDAHLIDEMLEQTTLERLARASDDARLFGLLGREQIENLIRSTYPLHPLSVFALVQLSSRVAQNERTMFTFLTSDEPYALRGLVRKHLDYAVFDFVRPAEIWDYFEDAVRADIGGLGTHRFWSGVTHALDKVAEDDRLGAQVVKTLGVLLICAENTSVRPNTEMIAWAVGQEVDTVEQALQNLQRRKVVIFRNVDGYWTFISGSDINFEARLADVLDRINPTPTQLRRLLEQVAPPPHTLARRYNQQRAMTRYFQGIYRWADELADSPWDTLIEREGADGLVLYVLAEDELDWQTAFDALQPHQQVVYVLPRKEQPLLSLTETLRELFALQEIQNDPELSDHEDKERIQREIAHLLEDAGARLQRIITNLIDPRQSGADWIVAKSDTAYGHRITGTAQTTKLVSQLCDAVFPKTPVLNNENLNRRDPSTQQRNAARDVINALFANEPSENFGLEGRGPDVLALNTLLVNTRILYQDESGAWHIGRPRDDKLAEVWDIIQDFLDRSQTQTMTASELIGTLTASPYGIRAGVLPVLIAAVMRDRLLVTSMKHDKRPVEIIDGNVLNDMVEKAEQYTIEIGEWDERLTRLEIALREHFDGYILDSERGQQPLALLKTAMIRWLQSQPEYCRSTDNVSDEAKKFRLLIRKGQMTPAKALFADLPDLLGVEQGTPVAEISQRIDRIMTEITNSYLELHRRLDEFATQHFGLDGNNSNGVTALKTWVATVEQQHGKPISEFRFNLRTTQELIDTIQQVDSSDTQFWDKASHAVEGVSLRDWNDKTEQRFYERLREAQEEIERDVQEMTDDDEVVVLSLQTSDNENHDFRFRTSNLSAQGQRILQNFKSTMEIAGRPISLDERRQIAVAFLIHMIGDDIDL